MKMKPCNDNIVRALRLVDEMIQLANEGDAEREDVGCGILYGMIRDSAYKIKQLAENEKTAHMKKGWWKAECGQAGTRAQLASALGDK
jgi:hypothetical protein